ncbi:MAG: hypothetical protein MJ236_04205 [Clostridia bacterium]|nr:hypothetical protein [Clostridia bacterium]
MKQRKKVVAAGILCLMANVFALVIGVFAWFTTTRTASDDDHSVVFNAQDLSIEYEMYKYNPESKMGERLREYDPLRFTLDEYDSFIVSRNEYINRIGRIDITFYKKISATTTLNVEIPCSAAYKNGTDILNEISNIIQFKFFVAYYTDSNGNKITGAAGTNDVVDETTPDTIYKTSNNFFKTSTTHYQFINGGTKTMVLNYSSAVVPTNAAGCVFYIEYNYSDQLVNDFYGNEGEERDVSVLSNHEAVDFHPDIDYIRFSLGD